MKATIKSLLLLLHFWFPVALGWSISLVMQRSTGLPISLTGISLFLTGICAAYSLDRLLDFPENQPNWLWYILLLGFIFSTVLGVVMSLRISAGLLSTIVVLSLISLFYRYIKSYPTAKTFLVALVWVWAGAALPIENNHWLAWNWWLYPISLPLLLEISAGCILCDLKDINSDKNAGVYSLPVILGVRNTIIIVFSLCILAAVFSLYQHRYGVFFSSLILAFLSCSPSILSKESIGPLLVDMTLTLPGILIFTKVV
jgi:4-hydroxybenzoate polyprenyltransferase